MKKIWLIGGFGNVLFQILAYDILKNNNYKEVFFVNLLTKKNRFTKLLNWKIHQQLYSKLIEENQFVEVSPLNVFRILTVGFLSKLINSYFSLSTFYQKNIDFHNAKISENIFGYFQEKSFLKNHRMEILAMGERLNQMFYKISNNDIVVHYRRGDSGWALLYNDYYIKVREMLSEEVGNICVVTDSLAEAEVFFGDVNNVKIVNSKNAIDDFVIMISTNNKLYCAPSTFSWWAAHSLSKSKHIIAPKFLDEHLGMFIKGDLTLI